MPDCCASAIVFLLFLWNCSFCSVLHDVLFLFLPFVSLTWWSFVPPPPVPHTHKTAVILPPPAIMCPTQLPITTDLPYHHACHYAINFYNQFFQNSPHTVRLHATKSNGKIQLRQNLDFSSPDFSSVSSSLTFRGVLPSFCLAAFWFLIHWWNTCWFAFIVFVFTVLFFGNICHSNDCNSFFFAEPYKALWTLRSGNHQGFFCPKKMKYVTLNFIARKFLIHLQQNCSLWCRN